MLSVLKEDTMIGELGLDISMTSNPSEAVPKYR